VNDLDDDLDPTALGTALRDRVRDEQPDLDHLVRVSTRDGGRIRRGRRTGAALAGVVGVAAAAVLAAQLAADGGTSGGRAPIAADPTPSSAAASPSPMETTPAPPDPESAPVRVEVAGWDCTEPMDEKFICTKGQTSVVVTWRAAAAHTDYLDPDKAGEDTFVSEVHGRFFATVAGGPTTPRQAIEKVGAALVWEE
jgi:hypothetical protein